MGVTDLHHLTIAEAARRIRRGTLSPVDLVEASLERIARLNPKLHAAVLVLDEEARRAARRAHRRIKAGDRIGPLHGIPLGLKDIYATKGIRTTAHSRLLLDNVPAADATSAARLFHSGMILVAKLATHEFALGGPAIDLPFSPAANPWGDDRFTGGSSSGSASAVASGMVPAALGSDTGGSIRIPAGLCGIAGFKPTYGLVSRAGVVPLSPSMDHCGPMAWTVEDAALLMDALAGPDASDPTSSAPARPIGFARALKGGVKGVRIGVIRRFYEEDAHATPAVGAGIEDALAVLRSLGARLIDIDLPPLSQWDACGRVIWQAEAYATHEADLRRRPLAYSRTTSERLLPGAGLSAAQYIQALRYRSVLLDAYRRAMARVDVAVTACMLATAPSLSTLLAKPGARGGSVMLPFNVTGAPALSVCSGFSSEGLPLSLQIVGKPGDDAMVLRTGHAYEQSAGWRQRRPPI